MKYKSFAVYDDSVFFDKYIQKRNKGNSPNEILEKPIMDELIGDIKDKEFLDLGCGDGRYGKSLILRGAKNYHGIDGSINMINYAKKILKGSQIKIEKYDIENYEFPIAKYDIAISRLVFHYIEDLEKTFIKIYKSLKVNGQLIFSIEHPIITSCYDSYHKKGKRQNWIVDNYFSPGPRTNIWLGKEVIKYHKTIEEYFQIFKLTGFQMIELRESKPQRENFENLVEFERRNRIPLFMIFKLVKKQS